jgi:O-antigen ligase
VTSTAATSREYAEVKKPTAKFVLTLVAGALLFGAISGALGESGSVFRIAGLAVVLLPLALLKRPWLAPAVLVSAAVLIEQVGAASRIPITGSIPLFSGLGGVHVQGADLLLATVVFVYLAKRADFAPARFSRSHVSLAIVVLLGAIVMAIVNGLSRHGQFQVAMMESRPYVYLAATYFVTAAMVTDRRALRAVLWAFVAAVGFKAVQGLYVYYGSRHLAVRPESYITHEASYFFVVFMVLVPALWVFNVSSGRLRAVATRLMPLVLACDLVNNRRAAWLMLGGAVLTFAVVSYFSLPTRRRFLARGIVALLLVSAVYFPVFWNQDGTLAQPARAVSSQVRPTARDASSDIYRLQENANLQFNITHAGLLGKGFGVPIDYALPIVDISLIDPLIAYIPHNDVLDVFMRMGLVGGIAMWFLVGSGIIGACRLARSPDREIGVVGGVVASAIVAYALMGAVDQGFFWYRIAFVTGTLLGLVDAARRLQSRAASAGQSARRPPHDDRANG